MTTASDNLKSIRTRIKKVAGLFEKPKALVQEIGVDIVAHAKDHGDCSEALNLVLAVPAQMQRSLIMWFMAVSPIGVLLRNEGENKVRLIKEDSKAYNDFDIDKACALNWWEMDAQEVEREIKALYAGGVFEDVIKRLDRIATGDDTKSVHYTDEARKAAADLKETIEKFRAGYTPTADNANDTETRAKSSERQAA